VSTAVSFRPEVTPDVLAWARKTARLTPEEIAQVCHCQREDVLAWETGSTQPTLPQLREFAGKCRRPLATFFLPKAPDTPELPPEFRTLTANGGLLQPDTLFAIRSALRIQAIAKELQQNLALLPSMTLPAIESLNDPEAAGRALRRLMNVTLAEQQSWTGPYHAVRAWRTHVEDLSIITLQLPFPISDARGFSLYDPEVPVVVINSRDFSTARCFTLLHEVGHLGLRVSGIFRSDMMFNLQARQEHEAELFCNRLAAEVLIPTEDPMLYSELQACVSGNEIRDGKIAETARALHISRFVVLRKLHSLGWVTLDQVQEKEAVWYTVPKPKTGGGSVPQAQLCVGRRGRRFVNLVFEALDNRLISYSELSEYLHIRVKHIDSLREFIGEQSGAR
jgi:Zn-dependent peptidase ImmA (M78 family)